MKSAAAGPANLRIERLFSYEVADDDLRSESHLGPDLVDGLEPRKFYVRPTAPALLSVTYGIP